MPERAGDAPPAQTGTVLTADLLAGLSETFFRHRFDAALETPWFHRVFWEMFTSEETRVAIAAPRNHAKSTAVTHVGGLSAMLTGWRDFMLLVGVTETQGVQFLNDYKTEVTENAALAAAFGVCDVEVDNEVDWVVALRDARAPGGVRRFRVLVKGVEQKLRGIKWRNRRPNLVLCDDIEDDESVESVARRVKLRSWFNRALLQAGSDYCLFRVVGTVMHSDALLVRLLRSGLWHSRRFEAHNAALDRESVLWPEKFPLERLLEIRSKFVEDGDPSGYAREYRNVAIDEATAMFRRGMFVAMKPEHWEAECRFYVGVDLAIATTAQGNFTVFAVGGVDAGERMQVRDVVRRRMDSDEIVEEFFRVQAAFHPDVFLVEDGQISKTLMPFLRAEMRRRGVYMVIETYTPVKDKRARARGFHAKMKAGGVVWDAEGEWYQDCVEELCEFDRGVYDDQVDALSLLGMALDTVSSGRTEDERGDDDWEAEHADAGERGGAATGFGRGRSATTGY